ncbi:MAG: alkaline phosphatase family protein [Mycobacterium sp.]
MKRLTAVASALAIAAIPAPPAHAVPQAQVPRFAHVVVVVEENRAAAAVIGDKEAPYINALAAGGALMTQSFAVTHPSQPNYVALFAGDTLGVDSDYCPQDLGDAPNLASGLLAAGYTFGGYAEGLPEVGSPVCRAGAYARKHLPWTNFTNVPPSASMPFSAFTGDASLPTVSFVVPDLGDDMHDGSIAEADSWLAAHLAGYAEWAKANNSLLIVTWDEDDDHKHNLYPTDNQIPTIFYGAGVRPGRYDQPISHYNVLSTIQEIYGLPKTGQAASAPPVTGIWMT